MTRKGIQGYLDGALKVLDKYGLAKVQEGEEYRLSGLLQDVVEVDPEGVLTITRVLQHCAAFNELARGKIGDFSFSTRYKDIVDAFNSVIEDSNKMVHNVEDGKLSWKEKMGYNWMKFRRGTPHQRFEKIRKLHRDVAHDTLDEVNNENEIMEAYADFRAAYKQAETVAYEVLKKQEVNREKSRQVWDVAVQTVKDYKGTDQAERSKLEFDRDELMREFQKQDRKYQLIKDVAECMTVGYNVGDAIAAKHKQVHDAKERVHAKSVTFVETNESNFTLLDLTYASMIGLNEATKTLEAMIEGANQGIEDIAGVSDQLIKEALKVGYGPTIKAETVKKLGDSIVKSVDESVQIIEEQRKAATDNALEVKKVVDQAKEQYRDALQKYSQSKTPETRVPEDVARHEQQKQATA